MPIRAPYNFIPISDWVYEPPWAKLASHDVPFRHGLSGAVNFKLIATTPLIVSRGRASRNARNARFFELPGGKFAIPGSSLRGMVRNVLEIATFSRFRLVHDARFALRTLNDRRYTNHFVERGELNGRSQARSKVFCGWLTYTEGGGQVTPCKYARIEQSDLAKLSLDKKGTATGGAAVAAEKARLFPNKALATHKYRDVLDALGALTVDGEIETDHRHPKADFDLFYDLAINVRAGNGWQLVFSGQPNTTKHLEFVFGGPDSGEAPRSVPPLVMQTFHDLRARYSDPEDDPWVFWRGDDGGAVPVFFLTDNKQRDGEITHLGMTQLFKFPRERTLHAAIPAPHLHLDPNRADFVETVFGFEGNEPGHSALKGRIDFATAPVVGQPDPTRPVPVVLMTPHATFAPNYVQQSTDPPGGSALSSPRYKEIHEPGAIVRGWKRYPAQPENPWQEPAQPRIAAKHCMSLHPLPKDTRFDCVLRFHNLLPVELGAMLWALTWGGESNLRHRIGLGKPYGFGQCRAELTAIDLLPNDPECAVQSLDAEALLSPAVEYMVEFIECMRHAYRLAKPSMSWDESEQIKMLVAMANPARWPASFASAHAPGPYIGDYKAHETARKAREVLPAYPLTPEQAHGM